MEASSMNDATLFGPPEPAPGPPFDRCPQCRYSLRGLPASGACPWCELRYDQDSVIHRAHNAFRLMLRAVLPVVFGQTLTFAVLFIVVDLSMAQLLTWRGGLTMLFPVSLALGVLLPTFRTAWVRFRSGYGVALTGDGLLCFHDSLAGQRPVPWGRIVSADLVGTEGEFPPAVRLELRNPRSSLTIGKRPVRLFDSPSEAQQFADDITSRIAAINAVDQGVGARASATGKAEVSQSPSSASAHTGLAHCPRCRFSLFGLPSRHTCPECGLRYDEDCFEFQVSAPKRVLRRLLVVVIVWVVIVGLAAREVFDGPPGFLDWALLVCAGFMSHFSVKQLHRGVLMYQKGFAVGVSTDGLITRISGSFDEFVPWTRITEVMVEEAAKRADSPTVLLTLREPVRELVIGEPPDRLFASPDDAAALATEIRRRMAIAAVDQFPAQDVKEQSQIA
jgi:hypothetical protein